jgi:hypothetical protein
MEYEFYLDEEKGINEPPLDQEVKVELRDPHTFEKFIAKVIISKDLTNLNNPDTLWLFSTFGRKPNPYYVKILEKEEEEFPEVKPLPARKLSLGERKGKMLIEMLKEREEKREKKKR